MGISARKILLWFFLLAVFFSIYTIWKINRSETQLREWVRTDLAPTDTSAGITVGDIRIHALDGYILLENLTYYDSISELRYQAESVSFTIGTKASVQMAILSAGYVLNNLESSEVTVSDVTDSFGDPVSETVKVNMTGSPLLLIPVFSEQAMPPNPLRVHAEIINLNFNLLSTLYPAVGLFIPNDETAQFLMDVHFDTNAEVVRFDTVRLEHEFFTLNVSGTVTPMQGEPWSVAPLDGQISVSELSLEMQNLFDNFEFLFGIRIPRDGDAVNVGVSGTASRPQIIR
jgi:hypothetical protein